MSTKPISQVKIRSGISEDFLEKTLTDDVTLLEALFDFIDNSIDAARNHLMSKKYSKDKYGLPKDYSGYNIHIRLEKNNIVIKDNCLGIDAPTLENRAFVTSSQSNHAFGIGHYGLGLKRSLLKFGTTYALSSDDGVNAFKIRFNKNSISGHLPIIADLYESKGLRKALFIINDLKSDVLYALNSKEWFDNALKELSIRYAIYIEKGLKIKITSAYHPGEIHFKKIPSIRTDGKLNPTNKHIKVGDVDVYIDSGIHYEYYFPSEEKHGSYQKNRKLTAEFGLYFICNDRVIVAHSSEEKYGWGPVKWHSEYNGFVCIVRFVAEDSSKMPWNTVKTALQTSNTAFIEVKNKLEPIASRYRSNVKKLYFTKGNQSSNTNNNNSTTSSSKNSDKNRNQGNNNREQNIKDGKDTNNGNPPNDLNNKNKGKTKSDSSNVSHPREWNTLLPPDCPTSNDEILNALIIEAKSLDLSSSYTSGLLLRAVLEKSLKHFVKSKNHVKAVRDYYYRKNQDKAPNYADKNGVSLDMILDWLISPQQVSIFENEHTSPVTRSIKNARKWSGKLNGIVHGNEVLGIAEIQSIRNEIYMLIKTAIVFTSK